MTKRLTGAALGLLTMAVFSLAWTMRADQPTSNAFKTAPNTPDKPKTATKPPAADRPQVNDERFHKQLLEVAQNYETYWRVDDTARWAPLLCRPAKVVPSLARFSRSDDESTHGQKLYFVFARRPSDYDALERTSQPVGQVIVKESWRPEKVSHGKKPNVQDDSLKAKTKQDSPALATVGQASYFPYAAKAGAHYRAAEKSALFIMMKVDPSTPGADEGWVYGTLTADGKQVTSAGRVASCMECHKDAKHDRLFGLPETANSPRRPETGPGDEKSAK